MELKSHTERLVSSYSFEHMEDGALYRVDFQIVMRGRMFKKKLSMEIWATGCQNGWDGYEDEVIQEAECRKDVTKFKKDCTEKLSLNMTKFRIPWRYMGL